MTLKESAYHAKIALEDDVVYVWTPRASYRIVPGAKAEATPLDLGFGATASAGALLYWSKGAIWQAPKNGGRPRHVAAVARRPEYFIASGKQLAWVDRSEEGQFALGGLNADGPKTLYRSPGSIDAATMLDNSAFFVERNRAMWRVGAVSCAGGAAVFAADRPGRSPSMLAAGRDRIFYYDGMNRQVRGLTKDLRGEQVVAKQVICSSLAVADSVYCGHVQGLFEIPLETREPRRLTTNQRNLVTAIAATSAGVAWISDTGQEQLAVRMLPKARR